MKLDRRHESGENHGARAGGSIKLPALFLVFLALAVAPAACSLSTEQASSTSEPSRESPGELTIAHSGWDESVALATLTGVVLEDEFGYEAELESAAPEGAFEMVAGGGADAFQGIWRPRHDDLVAAHEGDMEMLGGWLFGTTRASLAAPSYMDIRRLSDLERVAGLEKALVLDAEASGVGEVPAEVFERHGLEPSVYSDSPAMMEEAERLYEAEEPFVLLAYSPHWMNLEHDLVYLEDGEDGLLEDMNRPQTLHSAARTGLASEDPLAHAFLAEMSLTENQIESLELAIHEAEDPAEGARAWADSNEGLINLWVSLARESVP